MTDAFDRLEQQLRQATREHARPASAAPKRPRRGRGWKRAGLTVAMVALLGGGGAVAVAELAASPEQRRDGRHYAFMSIKLTAGLAVCRNPHADTAGSVKLTDAAPLPAISRVIPGIATSRPAEQTTVIKAITGKVFTTNPVLRSTLHQLSFDDGTTGAYYVQQGDGFSALRDPAACAAARRDQARRLTAGESAVVQRETFARLSAAHDTQQQAQTLWVVTRTPGGQLGGAGTPLTPGDRFAGGLLAHSAPAAKAVDQRGSYVGVADPRTTTMTVAVAHRRSEAPSAPARFGAFWSLRLPPRTGPVRLVERSADGTALRTVRLR